MPSPIEMVNDMYAVTGMAVAIKLNDIQTTRVTRLLLKITGEALGNDCPQPNDTLDYLEKKYGIK